MRNHNSYPRIPLVWKFSQPINCIQTMLLVSVAARIPSCCELLEQLTVDHATTENKNKGRCSSGCQVNFHIIYQYFCRLNIPPQAEDLARIRHNQRQSRARRQEYIRSLESRIQEYELKLASNELLHKTTVDRLQSDSDSMQSLLGGLGVIRGPQGRFIDDDIGIGNPPFSTVDFSEYK